jgi:hypothetical protein
LKLIFSFLWRNLSFGVGRYAYDDIRRRGVGFIPNDSVIRYRMVIKGAKYGRMDKVQDVLYFAVFLPYRYSPL